MSCPFRTYPLRKPEGHVPPIPRWQLVMPTGTQKVFTLYVGIQAHGSAGTRVEVHGKAVHYLDDWFLLSPYRPASHERFKVLGGDDVTGSSIWVGYWTDEVAFTSACEDLRLRSLYKGLGDERNAIGLWQEAFMTSVARLETNYSGLDYLPGLARLPGTHTAEHQYSAYWGAARDRIPASADDLFEVSAEASKTGTILDTMGKSLSGANYNNMIHIRSGQFWSNCSDDEREAYLKNLKPTLEVGLKYLWDNPQVTGTLGLRYLANVGANGDLQQETCGAGFFRSLGDLERWAESHPSHLAIFHGAIDHAQHFGESRRMRTWHEVSVLKQGEASFEYINCTKGTGIIRFTPLSAQDL